METFQHGARAGSGCRGSLWRHSNMARVGSGAQRVHVEASQQGARAGSGHRGSAWRHPNRAPGRAVGAERVVRIEKLEQ